MVLVEVSATALYTNVAGGAASREGFGRAGAVAGERANQYRASLLEASEEEALRFLISPPWNTVYEDHYSSIWYLITFRIM